MAKIDTTGMTDHEIYEANRAWILEDSGDYEEMEVSADCAVCSEASIAMGELVRCVAHDWEPGDLVTAYGKPGKILWVTPWRSVAVVFEDDLMFWFFGDDVLEIRDRGPHTAADDDSGGRQCDGSRRSV